jgi:hypothetical protein
MHQDQDGQSAEQRQSVFHPKPWTCHLLAKSAEIPEIQVHKQIDLLRFIPILFHAMRYALCALRFFTFLPSS